ncbi:RNA polymerase sigma factor [Peptoniphilus asaccharolyticus]
MNINYLIENARNDENKIELLEALNPLIISSIRRYCPIREEFEDLLQDGRVIVLECIETYKSDRGHFLNYVKNYLKFFYLDTLKYLVKHESKVTFLEPDFDVEDDYGMEDDVLYREMKIELYVAIKKLSDRQREVLVLYYFKRKSHSEIADQLGIKVRTVINTKVAAIKLVRKELEGKLYVD